MTGTNMRISWSDFMYALNAADDVDTTGDLPGMAAPKDAAFWGRVGQVWDAIEQALKESFLKGRTAADTAVRHAIQQAENAVMQLGHRARDLQAELLDRLERWMNAIVDRALRLIRPSIVVGAQTLRLDEVQVTFKISLGGSLSGSITEACKLAADGELSVEGSYRDAPSLGD